MSVLAFCIRAMNAVKGLRSNRATRGLPLLGRTRGNLMTTVKTLPYLRRGLTVCPPGEGYPVPQTESEVVDQEIEWELITQIMKPNERN